MILYIYVALNQSNYRTLLLIFLMFVCENYYICVVSILHPINLYCGQWTHCLMQIYVVSNGTTAHPLEKYFVLWIHIGTYGMILLSMNLYYDLVNSIVSLESILGFAKQYIVWIHFPSHELILRPVNTSCVLETILRPRKQCVQLIHTVFPMNSYTSCEIMLHHMNTFCILWNNIVFYKISIIAACCKTILHSIKLHCALWVQIVFWETILQPTKWYGVHWNSIAFHDSFLCPVT